MNKKILMSAALSAVMLSQVSFAAQSTRGAEQIYKECGIGGMFFGKSAPIGAVISNVTWDLGTTALSSNVSSADTCVTPEAKTVAFIHNSYDSIMLDSAKGNGKYLQSLSKLSNKDIPTIRSTVKSLTLASNYAEQNLTTKSTNLFNAVM